MSYKGIMVAEIQMTVEASCMIGKDGHVYKLADKANSRM